MLYKFSKFLYVLFIFYIGWFQDLFFSIPKMPLILGGGMLILLLLYKLQTSMKVYLAITKPISIWIFFSGYIFLTGIFVAYDKSHLISSIFTYIQTITMMIYIINISVIDKDNKFFLKSYLLYSIVYMFTMLVWGFNAPGGRLYLSASSNPNGDGLTLLIGVFCILMLFNPNKLRNFIFTFTFVILNIYVIILTGSRKSFAAVILLVLLWLILAFKKHLKGFSANKKILSIFILAGVLVIAMFKVVPIFLDSTLYWRLTEKGLSISNDIGRSVLYREAIQFFKINPLIGIGFNQFRNLSVYKGYSHSTYAEIISTTGIIGTMIYFSAYLIIIYHLFNLYIKTKRNITSIKALQYLIMMFIMLILGTGVIHFYGITDSIMFAFMISFYYTEEIKLKQINKN